jgi:hypothetical protein
LLGDLRHFELRDNGVYTWETVLEDQPALLRLVVPAGFRHDFASVPRPLWVLISPLDLGNASIFHDWLYRHRGGVATLRRAPGETAWSPVTTPWTRRDTDRLWARIMREQGVAKWRRRAAYRAVRLCGRSAWGA